MSKNILIVEDSLEMQRVFALYLEGREYDCTFVSSGEAALAALGEKAFTVVMVDLGLPDMDGLDLMKRINELGHECEMIVITGQSQPKIIDQATALGARDYLVKPPRQERLLTTIKNAFEHFDMQREITSIKKVEEELSGLEEIGLPENLHKLHRYADIASSSLAPLLIKGEEGVGKQVLAREIYERGGRHKGRFLLLDCAAIAQNKQRFKFAAQIRKAHAEHRATHFVIVFQNIAEMDIGLQQELAASLRDGADVFDSGVLSRTDLTVQYIFTSSSALENDRGQGRFSKELYRQINILPVTIPPLRDRADDIRHLVSYFMAEASRESGKAFKEVDGAALKALMSYSWPRNAAEVREVIYSIVASYDAPVLSAGLLPVHIREGAGKGAEGKKQPDGGIEKLRTHLFSDMSPEAIIPYRDVEKLFIEHAIKACDGDLKQAASLLGIGLATIYRKNPLKR